MNIIKKIMLCAVLFVFGCSQTQGQNEAEAETPKAIICHVQGVPNACYLFTPKSYSVWNNNGTFELHMTDEEGQETKVYNMSCIIMPREQVGDGACVE